MPATFVSLPFELIAHAAYFLPWRDEAALARACSPVAAALRATQRDRPVLTYRCIQEAVPKGSCKHPAGFWTGLPVGAVTHALATSQALEVIDLQPVLDHGSDFTRPWPRIAENGAARNLAHTAAVRETLTGDGLSRCASSQLRVLRLLLAFEGPAQLPRVVSSWRGSLRTLSLQVAVGPDDVSLVLAYAFQFVSLEVLELQMSKAGAECGAPQPAVVSVPPEIAASMPRGLTRLQVYGIYFDRHLRAALRERLPALESLVLMQCRVPRLYEVFEGCVFGRTLRTLRIDGCFVFHQHSRRTLRAVGHELSGCLEELFLEQAFWAIGPAAPLLKLAKLKRLYHAGDELGYDENPPSSMEEGMTDGRDDDERDDFASVFEALEARGVCVTESSYGVGGREVMDEHPDSDGEMDR